MLTRILHSLVHAILGGKSDIVELLLKHGARPNTGYQGINPLVHAVVEGHYLPALRIMLTATEQLPPLAPSYISDLTNSVPTAHQTL